MCYKHFILGKDQIKEHDLPPLTLRPLCLLSTLYLTKIISCLRPANTCTLDPASGGDVPNLLHHRWV